MAKIKVYELAMELNMRSIDILSFLQEKGIEAKVAQSSIDKEAAQLVRKAFGKGESEKTEATTEQKPPAKTETSQKQDASARLVSFEQMLKDSFGESARGRNDFTTKEVYEAVYNDVMKEVQENLSQMKPQLIRLVADRAAQKVVDQYEQRITQLERKISKITQLEQKISKIERNLQSGDVSNRAKVNTNNSNDNISNKAARRIDVSRIDRGFKFDGWIYYQNKNMGDFLYKVREDGRENTQLTDYSVQDPFMGDYRISDGYLYFYDAGGIERKIRLR